MAITHLDIRGLPVWERTPLVLEAFDRLKFGESVLVITDNEPRGLATHIEQSRRHELLADARRIGDREWHVAVTRTAIGTESPSPTAILERSVPFASLPGDAKAQLAEVATLHTVRRGHVISGEHAEWPYLAIVFEGVCALASRDGASRQRIFYEIFPYEVFGEMEFLDGGPTPGRLIVLSKAARYLRLPAEVIAHVGDRHPQLYRMLGRVASARSRDLMEELVSQGAKPIIARIAQVLVRYAPPEKGLAAAMAPLPSMTQSQIAAAAGTVKEVAARAIAELETREMLKRERGHIRYLDRQKLADLVREA